MVDRIGGALGQQWLQSLIQEQLRKAQPQAQRGEPGAPASLLSVLTNPLGDAIERGTRRVEEAFPEPIQPRPFDLGEAIGGIGGVLGGLFGGPPQATPESLTRPTSGSFTGGAGDVINTDIPRATNRVPGQEGVSPPLSIPIGELPARARASQAGVPFTGGAGGAGGAGGTGQFGSGLATEATITELLDNPEFAMQDMFRDRGINPNRNRYANIIAQKYGPIIGHLAALSMGQQGIGAGSNPADVAGRYNEFVNTFMGGGLDSASIVRGAMAAAEQDPSGTMAELIRDIGPAGLAQLVARISGQGRLLGGATERMLNERAIEARRRQQAAVEANPAEAIKEDDLGPLLAAFRGAL